METKEAKVGADIPQIDAKMSNMTQDLKNLETQTNINVGKCLGNALMFS